MPSTTNRFIVAVAGAGKTREIVELALSDPDRRVLIVTYTNENRSLIAKRVIERAGSTPANIELTTWYSFLLNDCARPYQRALTGDVGAIRGIDFQAERNQYVKSTNTRKYFFDSRYNMYRDGVSDFVCKLDAAADGAVIRRLEHIYDLILIDEMQDLVGYDLEVLHLLMKSTLSLVAVGDPRQHTLSTNRSPKNKKYRGAGMVDWFAEQSAICDVEHRVQNYRCNEQICRFADALFPHLPKSESMVTEVTGHDGVVYVAESEVVDYVDRYHPVALRYSRAFDTAGLPAINIRIAKGSTFDRVLIFPTGPMREYLTHLDPSKLKSPELLYVATTRARFSVAFVVPD